MKGKVLLGLMCAAILALVGHAKAGTVGWVNWTSATASSGTTPGSASGTMTFGTTTVNITYSGELDFGQTGSGTDYISPLSTYQSSTASNAPPAAELIALSGGTSFTDTVTFSSPVKDFLMAFVSLGAPPIAVTYNFNTKSPISVLSTGTGWWGGSINLAVGTNGSGNDTITGQESDGVIQFSGNFNSISWSIPGNGEYWDGFTFGAIGKGTVVGAVPLPSSVWMGLAGLGALGLLRLKATRMKPSEI